ncbi:metallopeptidase family protein [Mucisphaera calidilacus]|uniref:Possibl zinc metallo-peptidase n=1 Tax=Mucisphaera calidilacus TaxID=2527982 RepID=A0A518BYK5_9BACT|nr:metallopeptidase family protein [Mucisphaera calidilacus]QDU72052.1 Possibl zinc metallo-peptidase [Mucisphaera calidilacus]
MNALPQALRDRFDRILDHILDHLPEPILDRLDEMPLVVDDEPDPQTLAELGMEPDEELFGLHTGLGLTERSVEDDMVLPDEIRIFRGPIIRYAQEQGDALNEQIRITLLHEIGHHYGLEEEDLDRLGYA